MPAPVKDVEQHYEAFNMDNDYEGLTEINGEFFYTSKKKKRIQSKEESLYGYQSSDDDYDEGFGRRSGKRSKADYSKPVGFVSSGVYAPQQNDSKPKQQWPQQQQQQEDNTISNGSSSAGLGFSAGTDLGFASGSTAAAGLQSSTAGLGSSTSAAGVGLGFVSSGSSSAAGGGGLGFKSGGVQQGTTNEPGWQAAAKHQQHQGSDSEGEEAVLPTAFGKRIKAAAEQKLRKKAAQQREKAERAAARQKDPSFAAFEQHTKGIGFKLLEKMGYEPGKGLGRQKQGMAKPIDVKLRPKNMGMGFGDYHEVKHEAKPAAASAKAAVEAEELAQEMANAVAKAQASLWKKKAGPARQKRTYKTVDDVLQDAGAGVGAAKPLAAQPILDLRGPQARLVTDLEKLNETAGDGAGATADPVPPMPELAHNMGLLVSLTEAKLRRLDAALQHQQDTAALLAQETKRLQQEASAASAAALRLNSLASQLQAVQQIQPATAGGTAAALQQLHSGFAAMAAAFPEEYMLYSLSAAALSQVLPLLGELLHGWQPLLQPNYGVQEFATWQPLLESEASRQSVIGAWDEGNDPYAELVLQLVMPPIRSAISTWEPRTPEPLLAWLDLWSPLLPRGAQQQLLQGLVKPRLAAAVEAWDPTRETQPIHAWAHPWLPYLATELQGVYPTIRHRLSRALTAWHASDGSAALLLAPWKNVFEPADWEGLLQRSILPKLAQALHTELVLNPLAPQLEPFHWTMAWHDLMPAQHMAALLEAAFFPQWHALLHHWLSHTPDYDEVTRWYLEWKGMFPQNLLDHSRIRAGFSQALDMMNSAAEGQPIAPPAAAAPPPPPPAGDASIPSWRAELGGTAAAGSAAADGIGVSIGYGRAGAGINAGPEPSLKDLVARYAEEQGFEFMPRAGRLHDGLPVYSFGGVSCVIDAAHSVIRAQLKDRGWVPVSLDKLRQEAMTRSS